MCLAFLLFLAGVLEKLHEAAYKNALSNSLYSPDYMVGRITPEKVRLSVVVVCSPWQKCVSKL